MRLRRVVAEVFLPVDVLHHPCLMVVAPHLAVAHQYEQAVGACVSELHFGKQAVCGHGERLRRGCLGVVAYKQAPAGAQPQLVIFVGERLRDARCLRCYEPRCRASGKGVEPVFRGEVHLAVDDVYARHGRLHPPEGILVGVTVGGVDDIQDAACSSDAQILLLFLEARYVSVLYPAQQRGAVFLRNDVEHQTPAYPVDIAAVFAQDVGLQFHCGRVDVAPRVEYLSHLNLLLLVDVCLKHVLVARQQHYVAVVHGLYLYHLHVARLLFQLVVYVVVGFVILVEHIQMVVRVAYPQISVLVAYDVAHLARRHVRPVVGACYEGRERSAVERAQAVPCAEPHKAVAVFLRAVHRVAWQSALLGVVLHYHVGLGRGDSG